MKFFIGIDDAGRGPVIGPMLLAGVLVDEKQRKELKKIGCKDSKMLTPEKREELFSKIQAISTSYAVVATSPTEVDGRLSVGVNLNKVEAIKTAEIINTIIKEVEGKIFLNKDEKIEIVVDCPSPNTLEWHNYLHQHISEPEKINLKCEHKADVNHVECSAASILAKVTRDSEIEKIKKEIGHDFGSLPYDEEILIEEKGTLKLEKIGNIKNKKLPDLLVFSLNPKNYKIEKSKITNFIEHPKTKIYNVSLERGKEIRLSINHPLFMLNEKAELINKKLGDLKKGDYIAVTGNLVHEYCLDSINLIDYLRNFSGRNDPIFISGRPIEEVLYKNKPKIILLAKNNGYDRTVFYGWLKKGILPLDIFDKLNKRLSLKNCYLSSREEKVKISPIFKIDKEFMWFLGIFLAEGWCTRYNVCVSSQTKSVFERIAHFARKYNLKTHTNKDWIAFSSILFVKLLKSFNVGNNAYNKKIPEFTFSCSKENIISLLSGLYEGDGYLKDGNLEIELRSKEIIKQVQWLNLMLGNFCSYRLRRDKPAHITRIMSKSTNSLSPDNLPGIIGPYLKNLRESRELSQSELAKKMGTSQRVLSNIERKRVNVIEKKTLNKFIKQIPDKNLSRLINSDLCWLKTKSIKPVGTDFVYDLGVKNNENFIGGRVGILLHNSGYPSDPDTVKFLDEHAKDFKDHGIFRKSWSTWQESERKREQKKLDGF